MLHILGTDYEGALLEMHEQISAILEEQRGDGLKFYLEVELNMSQLVQDETHVKQFHSSPSRVLLTTNIDELVGIHRQIVVEKTETFLRNGSSWVVDSVDGVNIHIAE